MVIFVFVVLLIVFGITGVTCWAFSDVPMAIREVALNTRKEGATGSNYSLIGLLSIVLKVWAALIWLFGVAAAIAFLQVGNNLGTILSQGMM